MSLTDHEQSEIDQANESGRQPVVFVHGLWLLSSSWDRWRRLFEDSGYATIAPGWPDDPETVAEAREQPDVFARKMVQAVTDQYLGAIGGLRRKPSKNQAATEFAEIPDRGHSLTIDHGWEEVARTALDFIRKHGPVAG